MSFYAFKGFDKNLKCRDFQYEVGKTYTMSEKPKVCECGYHCCTQLSDVFLYYPLWTWATEGRNGFLIPETRVPSENRYCLVEVCGDVDTDWAACASSSKIATNRIKIIKELPLKDVINIQNDNKEHIERDAIARWILFGDGKYETDVTSKAIGLVEQVIEEGQQIYREDVTTHMSLLKNEISAHNCGADMREGDSE